MLHIYIYILQIHTYIHIYRWLGQNLGPNNVQPLACLFVFIAVLVKNKHKKIGPSNMEPHSYLRLCIYTFVFTYIYTHMYQRLHLSCRSFDIAGPVQTE